MILRTIDISDTRPTDWWLVGAGRANAVFAYRGLRSDLVNHVLRLSKPKKVIRQTSAVSLEAEVWLGHHQLLQSDAAIRCSYFADKFLAPTIATRYLPQQAIAMTGGDLAPQLLESIGQAVSGMPTETAMLLRNNTIFGAPSKMPVVCVEIKPKWGALPTAETIHPDNAIKHQTSRFCLQQALKLAQAKIDRVSQYDPIELFSDEPNRVVASTVALLREPQNNLQLFRDGCPAHFSGLESESGAEQLAEILSGWCENASPMDQAAVLAASIQAVLHDSGVLGGILELQKLDQYDIEGVALLYDLLLEEHKRQPPSLESPTPPREKGSPSSSDTRSRSTHSSISPCDVVVPVHRHCRRRSCSAGKRIDALNRWKAAHASLQSMSREDQCLVLRSYMTAVTAKDCSVMMALKPVRDQCFVLSDEAHGAITVGSQVFEYKVSIADLDFKPLERIKEHQLLDVSILAAAQKLKESRLLSQ